MAEAPAKQQDSVVIQDPHRDANRLSWPPRRSDLTAVLSWATAGTLIGLDRWPVLAALAIVGGVFAGLSPRMKGPFGFQGGGASLGGEFDDPFGEPTQADSAEPKQLGPAPESPPKRESDED